MVEIRESHTLDSLADFTNIEYGNSTTEVTLLDDYGFCTERIKVVKNGYENRFITPSERTISLDSP